MHTLHILKYRFLHAKPIEQIKFILPEFRIRLAHKGKHLSNLFSADAEPKNSEVIETTYCCYHFKCGCLSHNVGMTASSIKTRDTELRNPSSAKGIYYHIYSYPNYLSRLSEFKSLYLRPENKFFMQHFKILQKSFRSYFGRRRTKAFLCEFYGRI